MDGETRSPPGIRNQNLPTIQFKDRNAGALNRCKISESPRILFDDGLLRYPLMSHQQLPRHPSNVEQSATFLPFC